MHIFICDDIPELCSILKKQLLSIPYLKSTDTITEYHSADELLGAVQNITPDLLFLDIDMPGMSGMDMMRQHSSFFLKTKVVFLQLSLITYLTDIKCMLTVIL